MTNTPGFEPTADDDLPLEHLEQLAGQHPEADPDEGVAELTASELYGAEDSAPPAAAEAREVELKPAAPPSVASR